MSLQPNDRDRPLERIKCTCSYIDTCQWSNSIRFIAALMQSEQDHCSVWDTLQGSRDRSPLTLTRVYLCALCIGYKLVLFSSVSLEVKRAGQIIDREVQELPSGGEMPEVVPTIASLQDYKSITATWRVRSVLNLSFTT
jgi:hypothetical protein